MSNFRQILQTRYHIDLYSVNRALSSFNLKLEDDRQRKLSVCNRLIKDLGCNALTHPIDAETFAKTLIEQVILNGEDYDPVTAGRVATLRVEKIRSRMPELYADVEIEVVGRSSDDVKLKPAKKAKRAGKGEANDKKAAAYKIYVENANKSSGDIARLIAAELKITYANAHYYVSRVFK